jgi:hypothetical protein
MSEAPRVEINHSTLPDLDPSAPSNRAATDFSSDMPQTNGTANGGLAQSAQKTGNSILESEVRGTRRLRSCRAPANAMHYSLTCASHIRTPPNFPSNNLKAAQHAMNAGINHPSVQNAKDTVVNGEVSRSKTCLTCSDMC